MEGYYLVVFLFLVLLVGLTITSPIAERSDEERRYPLQRLWDQRLVGGDMIPEGNHQICNEEHQNISIRRNVTLFNALAKEIHKWVNGVIPYMIHDGRFDKNQRDQILKGMAHIEHRTCVKFVPRQTEEQYLNISNGKKGCWSGFGRWHPSPTPMYLNTSCFDDTGVVIIHELLHAVGLNHEHSRYDRDKYVIIHMENIMPEILRTNESYESTFDVACPPDWYTYDLPYDYTSIMHYAKSDFAIDRATKITIETRDSKYQDVIGRAKGMSKIDATKVNRMYGCSDPEWDEEEEQDDG